MSWDNEQVRAFPCGYCGAPAGEPCRTRKGVYVTPHADRFRQENAAWRRENPNYFEDAARGRDLPNHRTDS